MPVQVLILNLYVFGFWFQFCSRLGIIPWKRSESCICSCPGTDTFSVYSESVTGFATVLINKPFRILAPFKITLENKRSNSVQFIQRLSMFFNWGNNYTLATKPAFTDSLDLSYQLLIIRNYLIRYRTEHMYVKLCTFFNQN